MRISIEEIKAERKLLHCSITDAHRSLRRKYLLMEIEGFRTSKDNIPDKFADLLTHMVEVLG